MKKTVISSLLLSVSTIFVCAAPATQNAKDTLVDNNIVYPESFDTDTKDMMMSWYMQRYAAMDSLAKQPTVTNTTDAEYIDRLQNLPTVIEMPFNSVVKQYIEMYAVKRPQLIQKMLGLSLYYMPIFEDALESRQLPQELKYLPIIESALNPNAVSKAGAAGLWQFMPSTGTGKGLEVNSLVDERRDPIRSSKAAAQLLEELYNIYGDWALVLAAYNCGPGNVNKAIRNSGGKRDFWEIYNYLPKETRGYVPAFIAATYAMNYYGKHGISPVTARSPLITDTVMVDKRVNFEQISKVLGLSIDELRTLNPQFRKDIIPGNSEKKYTLILPSLQAWCYKANEDSILAYNREKYEQRAVVEPGTGKSKNQSEVTTAAAPTPAPGTAEAAQAETAKNDVAITYHTVQRGETLKSIAELYGIDPEDIRTANNLESGKVKRGTELKIVTQKPASQVAQTQTPAQAKPKQTTSAAPSTAVAQTTAHYSTPVSPQSKKGYSYNAKANNTKNYTNSKQKTPSNAKSANSKNSKASSKPVTVTVKKGESLEKIARKNGITVDELKKANGMKNDKLKEGQSLKVPKATKSSGKNSKNSKASSSKSSSSKSSKASSAKSSKSSNNKSSSKNTKSSKKKK